MASELLDGAEPVSLDAGPRGVLLLHGFGDTPQSVRGLATFLHQNDWTVRAPILRGHGSTLAAFTSARSTHWLSDSRQALEALRARTPRIAIIGQSMGGALATILAAETDPSALVLLAPYMRLSPRASAIAAFHPLVSIFTPLLTSRSEYSILDPAARSQALGKGVATPRLLYELSSIVREARRAAPRVRVPTLAIHSVRDPRVSRRNAQKAFASLGSATKSLLWAERSGHVISVDYDRDWVAQHVLDWLERHVTP